MFCKFQAATNNDNNYEYCRKLIKRLIDEGPNSPRFKADVYNTSGLMYLNKN